MLAPILSDRIKNPSDDGDDVDDNSAFTQSFSVSVLMRLYIAKYQ